VRVAARNRPIARDKQPGFAGGLNTTADLSQLAPNEMRRADNSRLTEFGGVTKCLGSQRTHASQLANSAVRGGFNWDNAGTIQQLAICAGTLFTGTFSIGMSWTSQGGSFSTTTLKSIVGFRNGSGNMAYLADGGLLNSWDGATLTMRIASTPSVARLAIYNQRLFGISGSDETLYYSALNNGDTLGIAASGGGSAVVRTFGKQTIIGLVSLGSSLFMIHKQGVSKFQGWTQDDISISTGTIALTPDVGSIAPGSIISVENVAFFLSDRGIYELTEEGVTPISEKIESVIKGLDHSLFSRVVASHHRAWKEVWFYFPDVGCYIWNYRLRQWTGPRTGLFLSATPYSMWDATDGSSNPIMLAGFSDGFVRQIDVSGLNKDDYLSDATGGTAFSAIVQCHRFFAGEFSTEKAWRWIYVTANLRGSQTSTVSYVTGNGAFGTTTFPQATSSIWSSANTWNSSNSWNSGGASLTRRAQASGRGAFIDVTITDDGTSNAVYSAVEVFGFDYGLRAA
jgi:hypothetical protein